MIAKPLLIAAPSAVIPVPREVATERITIADIAGNRGGYPGKQVTVRGEVEEAVHPKVFSLDEDAPLAGGIDNDLLAISTAQSATVVGEAKEGEELTVKGAVRPFITAEIEREYGLNLDPERVVDYARRITPRRWKIENGRSRHALLPFARRLSEVAAIVLIQAGTGGIS